LYLLYANKGYAESKDKKLNPWSPASDIYELAITLYSLLKRSIRTPGVVRKAREVQLLLLFF
jgi:hypothetical protein